MWWVVVQVAVVLLVLTLGIALGRIWEARTKTRSKKRIRRWDSEPELLMEADIPASLHGSDGRGA
jgi:hypothetical protein